jgi:hypothetical protein
MTTEKIISTLYKKANINPASKLSNPIRVESDEIIGLYKRAKAMPLEEGVKLMSFLKSGAVLPMEDGMIAKHQLNSLIEHIVGGIVDEVEKSKRNAGAKKKVSKPVSNPTSEPEESSHSQMDWEPSGENQPKRPMGGYDRKYEQWLEDLANKMWKDPEDIGHNHQGWKVNKVVPHGEGTTAYLLTLTKKYHKSRVFINRNGKWFWKDPVDRNQGWQEVDAPSMEPSIEQEQSGGGAAGGAPGGMTTTSAVSPVTGPNAFGKKKKWTEKFQGKQEKEEALDEMTTTSGGGGSSPGSPGYNIPGAFGRKMSNRKGHIEVLGYKMTPEGEKEYKREGDKLYESIKTTLKRMMREGNFDSLYSPYVPGGTEPLQQEGTRTKTCPHCNMMAVNGTWTHEQGCPASKKRVRETAMGSLGTKFASAQQHHDDHFFDGVPPDDPPEIQCPECGSPGYYTQQWNKGRNYQWSAKCDKCGNTWGDNNLDDPKGVDEIANPDPPKEGESPSDEYKKKWGHINMIVCPRCKGKKSEYGRARGELYHSEGHCSKCGGTGVVRAK